MTIFFMTNPIAKLIVEKGINNVDTSMFPDHKLIDIYMDAAQILQRLNRMDEAYVAMAKAGQPIPIEKIKAIANEKIGLGKYQEAYALLKNTDEKELAEFIKQNFL